MNIMFCDHCGKTYTEGNTEVKTLDHFLYSRKYDLCPACANALSEFLRAAEGDIREKYGLRPEDCYAYEQAQV